MKILWVVSALSLIGVSVLPVRAAETSKAQYAAQDEYYQIHGHYHSCGYYRYVCRAWWAGCRWEGPYFIGLPYWGMVYLCR
jgi:hypothetical protein